MTTGGLPAGQEYGSIESTTKHLYISHVSKERDIQQGFHQLRYPIWCPFQEEVEIFDTSNQRVYMRGWSNKCPNRQIAKACHRAKSSYALKGRWIPSCLVHTKVHPAQEQQRGWLAERGKRRR
jgi:hypothetical protein